jgi:small subunit ribosomal protein S27Ae
VRVLGKPARVHTYYQLREGRLVRTKRECPRCGRGFFMADHQDRWSCGRCSYTEFKGKGRGRA